MSRFPQFFPPLFNPPQAFSNTYHCSSCFAILRPEIDEGDKILLPSSALDRLARLNVQFPMVFEVVCSKSNKKFHCGVLEFSSDEGICVLPNWIMEIFQLSGGDTVQITNIILQKATMVRLKPLSSDFWQLSNPKTVFEIPLRKFTCLTLNNIIRIPYNNKFYDVQVTMLRPENQHKAVCIVETDCELEFEPPEQPIPIPQPKVIRPVEPPKLQRADGTFIDPNSPDEHKDSENTFKAFVGQGYRLDGKKISNESAPPTKKPVGSVSSLRSITSTSTSAPASKSNEDNSIKPTKYSKSRVNVQAFSGTGNILK